jgi:hypothetical protein
MFNSEAKEKHPPINDKEQEKENMTGEKTHE